MSVVRCQWSVVRRVGVSQRTTDNGPLTTDVRLQMSTKHRHTVLVVDDEPDVVKSVKDLLRLDYRVIGATSAAEGMEFLHNEEVHVVMTDQRMPATTGVEFLKHVRGEAPEAVR